MFCQVSKYGEDDIQLEGTDANMTDKLTYTFEDVLDQVQVGDTVYD